MAVVAKKDIENLTKQVLNEKRDILETIKHEHIQIDSSLLHENLVPEFTKKLNKIIEPQLELVDGESPISLNDMEAIISRFDKIDKMVSTTKTPNTNNPVGNVTVRKENYGIKRFGSMTDINKTLMRSSSTINLNSTKYFAEPCAPVPRAACNISMMPNNRPIESIHNADTPKLTSNQLVEHNALKQKIEACLISLQDEEDKNCSLFQQISNKYRISFDRLKHFADEVQRVQLNKAVDSENKSVLNALDQELLDLMKNLAETLTQVRFMIKNQRLYDSDGIKAIDFLLSDDLTDILEYFYRINK